MKPEKLYNNLVKNGFKLFTGVPDSTTQGLISLIQKGTYIPASSEGEAIGIATGYYLSSGEMAVVYMQNAGLGNAVNPLTSLTNKEVYSIPMLLLIGWRGHPEKEDAPQHKKMGLITPTLLDLLDIKHEVLSKDNNQIKRIKNYLDTNKKPFALLVKKGQVDYTPISLEKKGLSREKIIKELSKIDALFISTTGKASRELFEIRDGNHDNDFYNVGAMGCASSIALGVSLNTEKDVILLDGDGAALMKLGTIGTIGYEKPNNLTHIILNNQSYQSTGAQKTIPFNFKDLAKICGYPQTLKITSTKELTRFISDFESFKKPLLVEIKCNNYSRSELGRPTKSLKNIKKSFMKSTRVEKK